MKNDDLISRSALIAEYDRVHVGAPGGARKLMQDAPAVDAVEVVHGRWIKRVFQSDGYEHHVCSVCGAPAPFWTFNDCDYDEDFNGEWIYLGPRQIGINELITKHCSNCGARLRNKTKRRHAEYGW